MVPLKQAKSYRRKNQERTFLRGYDDTYDCFIDSTYVLLINISCSFFIKKNAVSGKGVTRAEKGQEYEFLLLLTLILMKKVLGKGVRKAREGYSNIDSTGKFCLVPLHSLSNRFNRVFQEKVYLE